MTNTSPPPEGWHPDPSNDYQLRWWDGQQWTGATRPYQHDKVSPSKPGPSPQLSGTTETTEFRGHKESIHLSTRAGRDPAVGGAALAGVITTLVTSLVGSAYLAGVAMLIFSLVSQQAGSPSRSLSYLIAVAGIIGLLLSLVISARLTGLIFRGQHYRFVSYWNLAIAYPLAFAAVGVISWLLGVTLLSSFFNGQRQINGLALILIALFYLLMTIYLIGKFLVWTSAWSKTTAMVLTFFYVALSTVAILAFSLALVTLIQNVHDLINGGGNGSLVTPEQVAGLQKGVTLRSNIEESFGVPMSQTEESVTGQNLPCLVYQSDNSALAPGGTVVGDAVVQESGGQWVLCFSGDGPSSTLESVDYRASATS